MWALRIQDFGPEQEIWWFGPIVSPEDAGKLVVSTGNITDVREALVVTPMSLESAHGMGMRVANTLSRMPKNASDLRKIAMGE